MARETLKDFLASKGSTANSISITRKEAPDGLGVDPQTGKELLDLVNETKGLLGDYVQFLVDNSSNSFKIKGGNELAAGSKRGDDLVLADDQGAENIFVQQGTFLKSKLNENSNSNQFDNSGTPLNSIIDKVSKDFDNHKVLNDIAGSSLSKSGNTLSQPNGEENDAVQATHKLFLKNNRFANVGSETNTAFTVKPQLVDDFESGDKTHNKGTLNVQDEFGNYDKNKNIVSIDDLKKLGASLLLKATGYDLGETPDASGDIQDMADGIKTLEINSNIDKNSGMSKINVNKLRVKNSKGFPSSESGESVRSNRGEAIEMDGSARNSNSFGATYNNTFNFFGNTTKLHKIQAAIALIAVKNLAKDFFDSFMELLREQDKISLTTDAETFLKENSKVDPIVYMLGQSRKLASSKIDYNVFKSLLTNTTYPYPDAVERGITVILGKDKDLDDPEKIINSKLISESPGYWLAVAKSILKTFDNQIEKYSGFSETLSTEDLFTIYSDIINTNKFIQFYNVMAVIGDISLQSTGGLIINDETTEFKHPRDVDSIPDNRAVHKSRKKFGLNKNELSWNQDAPPSMYILPANIIRAAGRLNNTVYGVNPVRGMFGSKLVKNTYTGIDVDGSYNRIPNEVVKVLEDRLEAEYVPFYIQDLRTNEIIAFNAFLDQLSDTISPNFTKTEGYGRMDPVQTYKSTSRNLQVGFTIVATNREDFDSMWYKINKLVTLLYPQWTPGSLVSNVADNVRSSKFYMPFSQVIGASPIVRLRIGDIIKSNYSRFALARTFGIGDAEVSPKTKDQNNFAVLGNLGNTQAYNTFTDVVLKIWLGIFGSPHSIVSSLFNMSGMGAEQGNLAKIAMKQSRGISLQLISNLLVNGFANPLAVDGIVRQLRDPNLSEDTFALFNPPVGSFKRQIDNSSTSLLSVNTGQGISGGYQTVNSATTFLRQMLLKPNMINGYYCADSGKKYLTSRAMKVRVLEKGIGFVGLPPNTIGYKVKVLDFNAPTSLANEELIVLHSDIYPDPKELFNNSIVGAALFLQDPVGAVLDSALSLADDYSQGVAGANELVDLIRSFYQRDEALFMRPELNPIVRSFETTKGRGLAGVLGSIGFSWLDDNFPWELDYNARAPIGCKITFSFDVIHDIPPGLDHTGYNRAPLYNVGNIMKNMAGDVYSDDGRQGEFNYDLEGGYAARVKGENNK